MNLVSVLIAPAVVALSVGPSAHAGPVRLRDRDRRRRDHRGGGRRHQAALHRRSPTPRRRARSADRSSSTAAKAARPPGRAAFAVLRAFSPRLAARPVHTVRLCAAPASSSSPPSPPPRWALSGCSGDRHRLPGRPPVRPRNGGCRRGDDRPGAVDGQGVRLAAGAAGVALHEAAVRRERPGRGRQGAVGLPRRRARRPSTRRCSGLDAAGPVAGGQRRRGRRQDQVGAHRPSARRSTRPRSPLDKIDPNNVSELVTALPQAVAPLQELSQAAGPDHRPAVEPRARGRRGQGAQLPEPLKKSG